MISNNSGSNSNPHMNNMDKAAEVGAKKAHKPADNHPWRQHRRPSPNMDTKRQIFWERQKLASIMAPTSPWSI